MFQFKRTRLINSSARGGVFVCTRQSTVFNLHAQKKDNGKVQFGAINKKNPTIDQ
jgi:hypothetical protein